MKTKLDFEIHNLEAAELAAKELLDHIEAIKKIQRDLAWDGVDADVTVRFTEEKK